MAHPDFPTPSLPRPAPVRCAADALRVLFSAAAEPLEPETLAFVLDSQGNGGIITVVAGTTQPDAVLVVAECMARAAHSVPRAAALVLATVRPHGSVLPGDIDRWLEASQLTATHGIQLLEWVVINQSGAQSPRDLLGEPERWHLQHHAPAS
jgi:hypothetical protein